MTTTGTRTVTHIRRLGLLLTALILLLVPLLYSVAGFFLLPYVLNNYLTVTVADKTGYRVELGDIRFNPFSWQLGIDHLRMHDAENRVLLGFTSLELDYAGLSIFRHELGVESLRLAGPQLDLSISADGQLLLATVFSRLADKAGEEKEQEKDMVMPALHIKELRVQNGVLDIQTAQLARPYRQELLLSELRVEDFHTTNEGHANSLYAKIGLGKNSTAGISGNISLAQSLASLRITLSQFDLQPLLQVLDLPFRGHIGPLPLDFATAASIDFGSKPAVQLHDTDLRLHDIRIAATADAPLLADIPLLHVQGVALDMHKQTVAINKLSVHDGKLQLAIDQHGQNNWQALLPAVAENPATPTTSAPSAWQLLIKDLQVNNHSLQLHSAQTATPVDLLLAPVNLALTDLQPLKPEQAFALKIDAGLPGQGTVALAGQVQLEPLQLAATLNMQSVALPLAQAYVNELAAVDIKQGLLASELKLDIRQQDTLQVQADGHLRIDDFQLYPQGSKKQLLAWQQLQIPQFSYALPANRLDIASIDLNRFYGRLTISANGKTNVQNLLSSSADLAEPLEPAIEAAVAEAEAASDHDQAVPALTWNIDVINIIDGETAFADLSLRPSFKTSIRNMSGHIRHISSSPEQLATVQLKGKVDEYAPVNIAGTFNLLAAQPQLDMALDFRNIELTSFSPYSGVYAGYKIDKGQLSMDLQYTLVDQRIKGKNHIVINQLVFGDKVESAKAIDLPLKLAIALLSDENGIIDLGFGVKGDLDSPEFSINDIIWKAVYELLKKTVTAPFTYLARLFKSGQENIQALDFAPGSEVLSDEASNKLATVAKMMKSKKMLQLNIQGNALPAIDKPALQEQELMQILSVETRQPPERFLPEANAAANTELYAIVADYYAKQRGEPITAIAQRIGGEGLTDSELKQSVYAAAWQELAETTPVTTEDINRLALRRARQAKALLVDKHQLDAGRVFVLDSKAAAIAPSLQTRLSVDAR